MIALAAGLAIAFAACGLGRARAAITRAGRPAPASVVGRAATSASPIGYLLAAQNRNGGFGQAPRQPSSTLYSGWAALGLAAEGHSPAAVRRGGPSVLTYVETHLATDPGSLERTILVVRAAGGAATEVDGHDLVAALERDVKADGSVRNQVNLTAFAVLALRAARVRLPPKMIPWLVRQQDRDGGFSYATAGDKADVDDTGAALQAIANRAPAAARRAVAYIRAAQNRDGGFPTSRGASSNAQSTAWAVQGLLAARVVVSTVHLRRGRSPLYYLRSLVMRNGAIDYARGVELTPVWVTSEALMALARKSLPLAPVA